jgi:uridine kinase
MKNLLIILAILTTSCLDNYYVSIDEAIKNEEDKFTYDTLDFSSMSTEDVIEYLVLNTENSLPTYDYNKYKYISDTPEGVSYHNTFREACMDIIYYYKKG